MAGPDNPPVLFASANVLLWTSIFIPVIIGAMNFVNPYTTMEVVKGIEDYMRQYGIENLDIVYNQSRR